MYQPDAADRFGRPVIKDRMGLSSGVRGEYAE